MDFPHLIDKKTIIICIILIASFKAGAQQGDSIILSNKLRDSLKVTLTQPLVTTAPMLGGITISDMRVPIKSDQGNFVLQQYSFEVGSPIYGKGKIRHPYFGILKLRYQGMHLSEDYGVGSNTFHSIQATLTHTVVLNKSEGKTVTFLGSVRLASDFKKKAGSEDFIYTGGIRVGWHQNSDFKYGFLLIYANTFAGHILIPFPEYNWKINQRWNLSGLLPIRTSLKYKLTQIHTVGATFGLNSGSYQLNGPTNDGKFLNFSQFSSGIIYDAVIQRRWKFNFIAAYTLSQQLRVITNDQKLGLNQFGKLFKLDSDPTFKSKGILIQAGISFLF